MDSTPSVVSSPTDSTASDPPEGVSAVTGLELMDISNDPDRNMENPLEIDLVIGRICSFLPGKKLLNCRLVNKQWNSSSICLLKNLQPFNRIELKHKKLMEYLHFIESRNTQNKSVEWYPEHIKYNLELEPEEEKLLPVQQLVKIFGPDCVESVNFIFPEKKGPVPDIIQKILHGTNLDSLHLRFNKKTIDTEMLLQMLNSCNSIKTLILKHVNYVEFPGGPRNILLTLVQIRKSLLDNIEELSLTIPGTNSFEMLSKIMLPNLKSLKLGFGGDEETEWKFPEHWQHFQDFLKLSCPSLVNCEIKLEYFVTEGKFLAPFIDRGISFKRTFHGIQFTMVPYHLTFFHRRDLEAQAAVFGGGEDQVSGN